MSSLAGDFPVLDYAKFQSDFQAFSDELFAASNKWGFFVLLGTGVNPDEMFDMSRQFFSLPTEEKASKMLNEQSIGYDGKTATTWAAAEGMTFGTNPGGILTTDHLPEWWDQERRGKIEAFKAQCYDLSIKLMSCYAVQLGLDKDYFLHSHQHQDPGNNLKYIHYPPMTEQPGRDVPRLAEHTDWGSITFVFSKQAGLEIRDPNNAWRQVPVFDGGIVVNIGDALSLWTGKALKSTMHRITWENLPKDKDRYSIAYFTNPNYDAILNPTKTAALTPELDTNLTYRDYYNLRLRLTYAVEDSKTGKGAGEGVDTSMLEVVRKLNVANSGTLESHMIKA